MKQIIYSILFLTTCTTNIINAQTTFINLGSNWNYYDNENEPASQDTLNWQDNNYDDSSWTSGNAHLGYGDGDETTLINDNTITAYFRHSFEVLDASFFDSVELNLVYDDGAIIYLNGHEIWRVNMADGPVDYNTFTLSNSGDNAIATLNLSNTLANGINVITVEIHQRSASSSDMSFDLRLRAFPPGLVYMSRGPYLQKASPTSMLIKWRTSLPAASILRYGDIPNNLSQVESNATSTTEHEIEITGLVPNTIYYYQIEDTTNVLKPAANNLYFKTSPLHGTQQPISIWVLGDCGTGNNNARAVRDAYYNFIGSNHTDMMLFLGDNAYTDGTDEEYQFALFENMYEDKLKNTVAWSCLGNHDGHSANSSSQTGPYYDIFSFPTAGESGGLPSGTEAYYSFDYGNVHFISLDSYDTDRSIGGTMYSWCESDIQNTTAEWIVAFWHHPPYSKGSHDSDTEGRLVQMRQNFLPMLESNGVDLVLSGHSHSYERSYFLNGHYDTSDSFDGNIHTVGPWGFGSGQQDGDGAYEKVTTGTEAGQGAVYITTGSAGKISIDSLNHNAMYYSVAELGSCVIEVDGNQMDVQFLRDTNTVTFEDYFSIVKSEATCDLLPDINSFCVRPTQCGTTPVVVDWADVPGAIGYDFFGQRDSPAGLPQLSRNVFNSGFNIPGFVPNNFPVLVQLRAQCANDIWGEWTTLTPYTISTADCAFCNVAIAIANEGKKQQVLQQTYSKNPYFQLYPNPTNGILHLVVPNKTNYQFEILHLNGQRLQQGITTARNTEINVTDLDKGLYILRLIGEEHQEVMKFTKG